MPGRSSPRGVPSGDVAAPSHARAARLGTTGFASLAVARIICVPPLHLGAPFIRDHRERVKNVRIQHASALRLCPYREVMRLRLRAPHRQAAHRLRRHRGQATRRGADRTTRSNRHGTSPRRSADGRIPRTCRSRSSRPPVPVQGGATAQTNGSFGLENQANKLAESGAISLRAQLALDLRSNR